MHGTGAVLYSVHLGTMLACIFFASVFHFIDGSLFPLFFFFWHIFGKA